MKWIRSHLKIVIPAAVAVVAVGAYVAFGVFGVQFLFIDDTVDEAAPVFDSGAGAGPAAVTETTAVTSVAPATTRPAESPSTDDGSGIQTPETTVAPTTVTPTTIPPTTEPQIVAVAAGAFGPRTHPGSGVASVLTDGSAQRFLRFEEFSTDNGPDLNVYLTVADADAPEGDFDDDFVDLGNLKGNIGDQNYEIPPDVDLERYDTVVVWCVRFSVAFTTADLVAT
ncbi:MAG: DM13 domain-containing protein [Acidimicrobiia bacterium]|nr:DM13 domain-containing protein [Acidimicrobiia bacterium]